jgi:hypothetical protein
MATRYAESNVSLAFDANLASGITTPGIATPGFEEVNDLLAPIVQPMSLEEDCLEGRVLPRADGGKDAWLVLIGCFTLEALVWGFVSHLNSLLAAETDSKLGSLGPSASSRITTRPTSLSTESHLASPPYRQHPVVSCSWLRRWWQFFASDSRRADVLLILSALRF